MKRSGFLAASTAALATPDRAYAAPASRQVRVGVLNSLSEIPLMVAKARNFFSDEGLDVTIVPFRNTADMVVPLANSQIDVGSGAPTIGYFNGVLRGISTKLVGDKGLLSPGHGFNALVVRKDLVTSGRVKSMRDLKGMTIASPSRWSPIEFLLDTALRGDGARLEDVKITDIAFPDMLVGLRNSAIDAALLIEPFVAAAVRGGVGTRFLGFDKTSPNFQIAAIMYSDGFAKREAAAKSWMVAYIRGIRAYLDVLNGKGDKSALFDMLAEQFSVTDRSIYNDVVLPGYETEGYLNIESISSSMAWFLSHGQLTSTPELRRFVNYAYVDAALTKLPRLAPKQVVT